ncbi:G2/mitotic-specific cyclin [Tieghemiomyces parasiticus]|uniref:G2/mitotic-specific cyclin n=1 Tax=Tieghemiomyces parasiticus TaxID=78921 RepID=A0A9W7ZGS8_9FUNG|nr:G2/mitotic-specific cyclin [Tieghemiomyces parasiticus]
MFNRANQTRVRAALPRKASSTTVYTDENAAPADTKTTKLPRRGAAGAKAVGVLQPKIAGNPVATRKRAALTDISNATGVEPPAKQLKTRTAEVANPLPRAAPRSRSDSVESSATVAAETVPAAKRKRPEDSQTAESDLEIATTDKRAKVPDWDDLDAEDVDDPLMVTEYVEDIFDYMLHLEVRALPNPCYMDQQRELSWKMRGILVDWLIDVHGKFRLLGETLFLTVNLIDRFLSLRTVSLVKLQLVGITSMFCAAKYEEIMPPSVHNFVYMTDNGYTEEEVLEAERYLLKVLNFDLSYPNPLNFLRRVSKADGYDLQTRTIAKYLMDISLVDHRLLACPPSMLAAAGTYLARQMLNRGGWDANLRHYSGYTEMEILPCVQLMVEYLAQPIQHENLFKKYTNKRLCKASIVARDWVQAQYPQLVPSGSRDAVVIAPSLNPPATDLVEDVAL